MRKREFLIFMATGLIVAAFFCSGSQVAAQSAAPIFQYAPNIVPAGAMGFNPNVNYTLPNWSQSPNLRKFVDTLPGLGAPGCTPGTKLLNYTDGTCNQNNLGQYIPIAVPDISTFPGSVFYDIAATNYSVQMHSDLPATGTALRGYLQVNGTGPGQTNLPAVGGVNQYLGPLLIARVYDPTKPAGAPTTTSLASLIGLGGNGWPVRLKFTNSLPLSNNTTTCATNPAGSPKLCLPVDPTIMGAGMGPLGPAPYGTTACDMGVQANCDMFTENRVTIPHLHGGRTPWISDGTPHQWITPVGDPIPGTAIPGFPYGMKKGVSIQNVPDMIGAGPGQVPNTANDGTATVYYTNQQSARLMFWHDHVYGITRLNVYKGVAAGYLLVDQVEDDLIDGSNTSGGNPAAVPILPSLGGVYRYGIPLVIQDKAFVNDAATDALRSPNFPLATYDPTSHTYESAAACWPTGYLNVTDSSCGTDPLWYSYVGSTGGQLWISHEYMPVENIYDPTGNATNGRWDYGPFLIPPMIPTNLTLPSPTLTPEAFGDTMVVNGTAFPYIELPPDAIRFRILGVGNDRVLNLQLYKADPLTLSLINRGTGYTAPPLVTIAGGGGTYTSATAVVSTGEITGITAARNCVGFVDPPTVTLSGGGGSCTSISAIIPSNSTGQVLDFQYSGCTGFTSAPAVTITGGGGLTCAATATVVPPGQLLGVTVTGAAGYTSDPIVTIAAPSPGPGTTATAAAHANTEVRMVDAAPNPLYPTWPADGRDGGVPDPTMQGPPWILIGNEGGLLAQANVISQQPIDYEYVRQSIPFAGITSHSLLLLPAQRADVIVDLRGYHDGDTFIIYNDAGAPVPMFWPLNDYYTDDADQRLVGGPPPTPPGFGPNTRTIMQIRIKTPVGFTPSTFSLPALKTALPKAFAKAQDKPIVPQVIYNDAFPGFATKDVFAQSVDSTLNLLGTGQSILKIKTTAPGNNYTVAPKVVIIGDGKNATATAGLNPCGGVTLLTAGTGYTSAPTCTIGPAGAGGVRATCVATVSGGIVSAIQLDEPGSNYSTATAATCALTGGGGTGATCSTFVAVANTVGSISITNAGIGYTREPRVYIVPNNAGALGATAVALLNGAGIFTYKNITEGFDPDYGRLDIRLGSTPNPLTPTVGAGMVMGIARYVDPPTELLTDGQNTLWRLTHLGVDSHALHFHLFDVQVVNRVDWTNVVKPPYPDEVGWRDTIRTNPMEDIIVAFRPHTVYLPFQIPNSSRLLDVTTPVNSVTNFLPIAPPPGITAVPQSSNLITDFGWEYVWHCHMLEHEENDFMRAMVLNVVPPAAPTNLVGVSGATGVNLTWNYVQGTTLATGFQVQRATGAGAFATLAAATTLPLTPLSFIDTTAVVGTTYRYQVIAFSATNLSSSPSNIVTITFTGPPPLAATNLVATPVPTGISLTWAYVQGTTLATGFRVQRATGAGAFATLAAATNLPLTPLSFIDTTAVVGTTYRYQVVAFSGAVNAAPSNIVTVTIVLPAAPTNLVGVSGTTGVNLTWAYTQGATLATGFQVQRATGAGAFATLPAATNLPLTPLSFIDTTAVVGTTYRYQVIAFSATNLFSLPSNIVTVTMTGPPPAAATNLVATPVPTGISLTWNYVQGTTPATGFQVQRMGAKSFATIATLPVTQLSFIDTTATAGTYTYQIVAFSGSVLAPPSNTATATSTLVLLAAPTNLRVQFMGSGFFNLAWTQTNTAGVTGFTVQRLNAGVWTTIGTVAMPQTTFQNSGLIRGTSYSYQVLATGAGGAISNPSNTLTVTYTGK